MPAKIIFTQEQIEQIIKLHNEGIGAGKIALQFNISKRVILNLINNLGLSKLNNKKIILPEQYEQIKKLQLLGTRKIAKILNLSRSIVIRAFNELGIKNIERSKLAGLATHKQCKGPCGLIKEVSNFYSKIGKNGGTYYSSYCKECDLVRSKEYMKNNAETIKIKQKEYRQNNKDKLKKINTEYNRNRRHNDIIFRLRKNISSFIAGALKRNDGSKLGVSIEKFLPFTIEELKTHIERLFESWMNWDNYGKYNAKIWDDDNSSTWTWQLDHITPNSTFKCATMDCQEFRNCWALSNLRPLSAKQNQLDGCTRVRHK